MELEGNARPLRIIDPIGDEIPKKNIDLYDCLYDGALLTLQYAPGISLIVMGHSRGSFTIHVPPVRISLHRMVFTSVNCRTAM